MIISQWVFGAAAGVQEASACEDHDHVDHRPPFRESSVLGTVNYAIDLGDDVHRLVLSILVTIGCTAAGIGVHALARRLGWKKT